MICLPRVATGTTQAKVRYTPGECSEIDGCWCFTPEGLKVISQKYIELKKCRASLVATKELFDRQYKDFHGDQGQSWWQDPYVIIGGVTVTVGVTALVTYALVKK